MNFKEKEDREGNFESLAESLNWHMIWLKNEREGAPACFMNIDFSGFNFSSFDISKVVFKNCNFRDTIFGGEGFNGAEFVGCFFSRASFLVKKIHNTLFENSNFSLARFTECEISSCIFKKCFGEKPSFYRCHIKTSEFAFLSFESASFGLCKIAGSNFGESIFTTGGFASATLQKSLFMSVVFFGVDLEASKFTACTFVETKFKSCKDGVKTRFDDTLFQDCNFSKCTFEEKKDFLSKIIIKTKQNKSIILLKKWVFALKTAVACVSFCVFLLAFKGKLGPISSLILSIILSIILLAKTFIFEKIEYLKSYFLLKIIVISVLLSFSIGAFYINWMQSLKYQSFSLSIALLSLFAMSSFNVCSYFKKVFESRAGE